jgi:hypothetical protein
MGYVFRALERIHDAVVGERPGAEPGLALPRPPTSPQSGPQEPHQFALTPVAEAAEDDSDAKADGDDGRDQQDIAGGCP